MKVHSHVGVGGAHVLIAQTNKVMTQPAGFLGRDITPWALSDPLVIGLVAGASTSAAFRWLELSTKHL